MTLKQYEKITRELRNHVFSFIGERKEELEKEIEQYKIISTHDLPLHRTRDSNLIRFVTSVGQEIILEDYFLGLWKIYIKYFPTRARAEEYLYYRFAYQLSDRQKQFLLL
jgi:hypothetical protein